MSSEPTSPGPWVTAMPSRSGSATPAVSRARLMTGKMTSMWRRDASSGTIPPYGAWTSSCEATMFDRILRPPSRTAAAVSSQEVSIPSTIMIPGPLPSRLRRPVHSIGQLGDGHQLRAAGFPSRHVLLQQTRRRRLPMHDHDHVGTLLRPLSHLAPARPLHALAARGLD